MDKRLEVAKQAALAAAQEILRYDPSTVETHTKTTAGDLVTAADEASEATITKLIRGAFPDDLIISEETNDHHELLIESNLPSLTAWVLDPLDGTNNFRRDMHYSAVSIAYVENGRPVLGVAYDPYRQDMYIGRVGETSTKNGELIQVGSKQAFDSDTRVCTSNSYEGGTRESLMRYQKLGHVWVDVLGSGIHIMLDVACGRLDLYHHNGLKPFDNPAAFLIAAGAGAKITDLAGKPVSWLTSDIVMGNPTLVDAFTEQTAG